MKSYLSLIEINLKLAFREKVVLFFNFVFPLAFFFIFGIMLDAAQGGVGVRVVSMVLVIGVLGNGLFGAGIRAVVERETNILRRYKVAPISAAPLLVASVVTGWLLYLPVIVMVMALARILWGVAVPERWPELLVLLSVGAWSMRAIGLIVASVVNSAQESNVLIQLLYMPMLFLSGATFPLSSLPEWAQVLSQFLPASYLHNGMERIMIRGEGLVENASSVLALLLSTVVATWISMKIFRWEKEETIPRSAKLWLLVVGLPFLVLGAYQAYSRENIDQAKAMDRELRRSRTRLLRGARIFVGDGTVIASGGVLIRDGKVAAVYDGAIPDPESLDAEVVEAAGKTVLPGLIDAHVHLGAPGGLPAAAGEYDVAASMDRALAAYLYSGVVAVKSAGDALEPVIAARHRVAAAQTLGAEVFLCGPLFTTEGGHGTEYLDRIPEAMRVVAREQFLRLPETLEEARSQVAALEGAGVDGISLDVTLLRAIAAEARSRNLPLAVHTGDARDITDAVAAGAAVVEHGSFREAIPEE
ncbi:MAG: ABC transporter permease, partial [bacterium]|nr:ABC transporter permease [bacterium]